MSNAQTRFFDALALAQEKCAAPNNMPHVCIAGYNDFQELLSECWRDSTYSLPIAGTLEIEDAEELKTKLIEEIEDPELRALQLIPKQSQLVGKEWDPEVKPSKKIDPRDPSPTLTDADSRKALSETLSFEFCGATVFRSMNIDRGFFFA